MSGNAESNEATISKDTYDEQEKQNSGLPMILKKCEQIYRVELKKFEEKFCQQISDYFNNQKLTDFYANVKFAEESEDANLTNKESRAKLHDAEDQIKAMNAKLLKKSHDAELANEKLNKQLLDEQNQKLTDFHAYVKLVEESEDDKLAIKELRSKLHYIKDQIQAMSAELLKKCQDAELTSEEFNKQLKDTQDQKQVLIDELTEKCQNAEMVIDELRKELIVAQNQKLIDFYADLELVEENEDANLTNKELQAKLHDTEDQMQAMSAELLEKDQDAKLANEELKKQLKDAQDQMQAMSAQLLKKDQDAKLANEEFNKQLQNAQDQKQVLIDKLNEKCRNSQLANDKLRNEIKLSIVGSIRISPSCPIIFTRQKSAINIDLTNQTDSLIFWKVYVSPDLVACITFLPNDGIIKPQKVGIVNTKWSLKKPAASKCPSSFTFTWSTVPAGNKSAKKIGESWLVDRPIRQKIIYVQMNSD